MTHISIFGSGNTGHVIAGLAGKGGNTVELMSSSDEHKEVTGDMAVPAVPYPAVAQVIAQCGAQPAGKGRRRRHEPAGLRDLRLADRASRRGGRHQAGP